MKMLDMTSAMPAVTDVYTNLHGMEQLKTEKNTDHALKKVAEQFESMFVTMMLKNMRQANAVFEKDSMFNSSETKFYRDMYDQQLSLSLSHGRGLGIADSMYRQMSRNYGSGDVETPLANKNSSLPLDMKNTAQSDAQLARYMMALRESSQSKESSNSTNIPSSSPSLNYVMKTSGGLLNNNAEAASKIASTPEEFVATLLPFAKQAGEKLGVDEKIILAQSALETGWGEKVLVSSNGESSNNLFNIKQGSTWQGDSLKVNTIEVYNGQEKLESADFRKYSSVEKSFEDYVNFIANSDRYKKALDTASGLNNSENHSTQKYASEKYIQGIHNAGYATDPNYANKVMRVYDKVSNLVEHLASTETLGQSIGGSINHLTQEALNSLQSGLGEAFSSSSKAVNIGDINLNPMNSGMK